jgi:List-Bact-rpt repeat protein
VRAVFGPASYPLTLRVRGNGRIAGDATCRTTCRFAVDYPERTRLRAVAAKGWRFVGWGGACRGAKACVVTATAARAVTATFARRRG